MNQAIPAGRLLIVDDEPQILRSMKRMLNLANYQVVAFDCAQKALEYLTTSQDSSASIVDIIISDMRMPNMSGDTFLHHVASKWPKTTRILLTGFSDVESTKNAINKGNISAFLQKPWNDDEVLDVIKKGLVHARQEHQKDEQMAHIDLNLQEAKLECKYNTLASIKALSLLEQARFGGEHQQPLMNLLLNLADAMGLDDEQQEQLYHASSISKLGLLPLPEGITNTPDVRLSKYDRQKRNKHPDIAFEVLRTLPDLQDVALLLKHHTERYDGSGPHQLIGEEIPLPAQILGIGTHIIDLKSGQYSGHRMTTDECILHLKAASGREFSVDLVEHAYRMLEYTQQLNAPKQPKRSTAQKKIPLDENNALTEDLFDDNGRLLLKKGTEIDHNLLIELQRRVRHPR